MGPAVGRWYENKTNNQVDYKKFPSVKKKKDIPWNQNTEDINLDKEEDDGVIHMKLEELIKKVIKTVSF